MTSFLPRRPRVPGLGRGRTPVVLVHGLGVSGRYMVPITRRLGTDMRVLAPDLPGLGRSDEPDRAPPSRPGTPRPRPSSARPTAGACGK